MPFGDKAYLEARVEILPESGCWIWLQQLDAYGYGQVRRTKTDAWRKVHRLAYELWHGEIPEGKHVLHRCHVRCCVNPAHLYAGTQLDNVHDMLSAGRGRWQGGALAVV